MLKIDPKNLIILAIIFITLFEATAQVCLKKFDSNNQKTYYFYIIGTILYFIILNLLCYCYKNKGNLSSVNVMWSCMSIIFVFIFGYIFLKEKINKNKIIAIILAFLAIYFANLD